MKNWKYIEGAKVGNGVWYGEAWNGDKFCYYKDKDDNTAEVSKKVDKNGNASWIVTLRSGKSSGYYGRFIGEYSDFKKAKKVAEDKVHAANTGNSKVGNKVEVLKDGAVWVVLYAEGTKSKEFDSEDEAKKFAAQVGNESLGEYMAKKPRVINEEKTGAEEFFKKLSDDVKEREDKDDADIEKIGNAKDKNDRDMKIGDMVDVHGKKGKIQKIITAKDSRDDVIEVFFDNSGTYNPDRTDRFYANEVVKVGNKKLKFTDKKDGKIEYLYDEESKDGYIYYDGKLVDTKKAVGPGWVDLIKQKAFSSGVMNKTGNSASEYEILKQDPSKMHPMYKKAYEEAMKKLAREDEDFKKRFEREYGVKAKNSESDDKFAYVMREFDEGKLKTPDGKVVTDPAQAKAIAYSESKKTENGLARARNAMNAWNSERKIEPVGKYKEFIRDLKNAMMLDVSAVTYNNVDEQTLKSWVEQAKKEGFGSAIKGVQGKKVILDVY